MSYPSCAVELRRASFTWPDGGRVFSDLTAAIPPGPTAVVGPNGGGKSTLLRLIAGDLHLTAGEVAVRGGTAYLPQHLPARASHTVADALGVAPILRAIAAIEGGSCDQRDFDTVGDRWDAESRARAELAAVGLPDVEPTRPLDELSGGEATLVSLAGVRLTDAEVVLLDEPSNDLDDEGRQSVVEYVATWPATVIFASHDRDLLRLAQTTLEVRCGHARVYPGPFDELQEQIRAEQLAAEQALAIGRKELAAQRRQRQATETALARRARRGRAVANSGSIPRILANKRKSAAEATAGRERAAAARRVERAEAVVADREVALREDVVINLRPLDPDLPSSKRVWSVTDGQRSVAVCGPRRVALTGPNGIGKTRLIETLMVGKSSSQPSPDAGPHSSSTAACRCQGLSRPSADHLSARHRWQAPDGPDGARIRGWIHTRRVGYLPQRVTDTGFEGSALDHVLATRPEANPDRARAQLARVGIRGDLALRPWSALSGGERFRVAMAGLLAAEPMHELLVLDEPTNHLDADSVQHLVAGLREFRGALLVVSHDRAFLDDVGIDMWMALSPEGLAVDGGPAGRTWLRTPADPGEAHILGA